MTFQQRRSMARALARVALATLAFLPARPVQAYRPFNLTDASVADPREMEVECGPLGYVVDAEGRFLVAPSAILNFGFADRWELVLEGRQFFRLRDDSARRYTLRDAALSVKTVLRPGSLQDQSGPSVGLEVGVLIPGVGIDSGVGASVGGLVSHRWSAAALHVNGVLELTHNHRWAGIAGAILEGPSQWKVRPVAELVVEQGDGREVSGLVGGIWQVRDKLSLDVGWRLARTDGETQRELRAGFTWAVPLGAGPSNEPGTRNRPRTGFPL